MKTKSTLSSSSIRLALSPVSRMIHTLGAHLMAKFSAFFICSILPNQGSTAQYFTSTPNQSISWTTAAKKSPSSTPTSTKTRPSLGACFACLAINIAQQLACKWWGFRDLKHFTSLHISSQHHNSSVQTAQFSDSSIMFHPHCVSTECQVAGHCKLHRRSVASFAAPRR